ncbi:MAG: hypothetical protein AAGH41_02510 [Pseudomonadota bacterium]
MLMIVVATLGAGPLADLEGAWAGSLQYRDYQSDALVALPMRTENRLHGDILIQQTFFTDPGREVLRAGTIAVDLEAGKAYETYAASNAAEASVSDVTFEPTKSGWRVTTLRRGEDDNAPAMIRMVMELDGDRFTAEKTVDPEGDGRDVFLFRNRVVLERE